MSENTLFRKKIAITGATGSVGMQALDVARHFNMDVTAISCARDIKSAEKIIREFSPKLCGVTDRDAARELRIGVADTQCKIVDGELSAEYIAEEADADTVLNSVTGIAGLRPSVAALRSGKRLALANKESLVTAGKIVTYLSEEKGLSILPVDSEHCAIWQALLCGRNSQVKRIILTASGGPFRGMSKEEIATKKAVDALKHPTWNMGRKITIDSATMMNKGFEIIEAAWLFGFEPEKIDVIVHPESIIHSMVEYDDNAVIAQMAVPDMRLCVQYALTAPERYSGVTPALDLADIGKMTFYKPDTEAFPLLELAKTAYSKGGAACAALNAANEVAVALFLEDKISLPELFYLVEKTTLETSEVECAAIDDVFEVDKDARRRVKEQYSQILRTST